MGLLRENKPSNHMVSVGTKVSRWERYEATQIEDEWYIIAQNVNRDNDKKREIEVDSEEPITLLRLMTLASRLPIIQENKRLKKEDVDELIQEKDLRLILQFCKENGLPCWGLGTREFLCFQNDEKVDMLNKMAAMRANDTFSEADKDEADEDEELERLLKITKTKPRCSGFSISVFCYALKLLYSDFCNMIAYYKITDNVYTSMLTEVDKEYISKMKRMYENHAIQMFLLTRDFCSFRTCLETDDNSRKLMFKLKTENLMHLAQYYLCLIAISGNVDGHVKQCIACGSLFTTRDPIRKYCSECLSQKTLDLKNFQETDE